MQEPRVFNVYNLTAVPNVCNQTLREVMALDTVSFAHVTMDPNNISLLHKHDGMNEIYFILSGEGILYHGDKSLKVQKGAYLHLPEQTAHKLRNIGEVQLEHLVFAVPPFNQNDVHLLEDNNTEPFPEKYEMDITPVTAQDGAIVYELLPEKLRIKLGIELALGILPPERKAKPHLHPVAKEVYYVISGNANLRLGDSTKDVRAGSVIYLPPNTPHGLQNPNDTVLEVLCLSSPPYSDADFVQVMNFKENI